MLKMNLGMFARRSKLYLSVFIVNLLYFSCGTTITWTSPTIPYLQSPNPILVINDEQSSYITSSTITGQIFGPLLSGLLTAYIGRKWSLYVVVCMFVVQWIFLGLALNVDSLCYARLIGGAATGFSFSILPMYVAEIAEDDIRSVLNTIPFASRSVGLLLCYSVGPFVSYRLLIYICAAVPVIMLVLTLLLPESPYYLIDVGKKEKAFKELSWLRGTSADKINEELNAIQASRDKRKGEQVSWSQFLKSRANIKAMLYSMAVRFSQEITGISVILYLLESIFITSNVPLSSSICAIIVGFVMFISGCISPIVVNKYGYKKPFVVCSIGVAASLAVLGLHFFLVDNGHRFSWLTYVPLACLIVYAIFYSVGVVNTSFAIVGEIFAPNARALGTSISNSFGFLVGVITVRYYYDLKDFPGTCVVMWTYSLLLLLGTVFIGINIPNTSRMSLEEIQQHLNNSNAKSNKKNKYYLNSAFENITE